MTTNIDVLTIRNLTIGKDSGCCSQHVTRRWKSFTQATRGLRLPNPSVHRHKGEVPPQSTQTTVHTSRNREQHLKPVSKNRRIVSQTIKQQQIRRQMTIQPTQAPISGLNIPKPTPSQYSPSPHAPALYAPPLHDPSLQPPSSYAACVSGSPLHPFQYA